MEKTRPEDGMKEELSRLESLDHEFLTKVDQFLEEQSLVRAQTHETTQAPAKRREIGFVWRVFDDETLANIALGLTSAATISLPFFVYYALKGLGVTNSDREPTLIIVTVILSFICLVVSNLVIWDARWPKNLFTNIFRGLRYRHYLKVAKTFPEATLYDVIALNGSKIDEEYPDCNILRLKSGQFLRLKPVYAKIFSGKSSLNLEHILDYMKNVILVRDLLKNIPNT